MPPSEPGAPAAAGHGARREGRAREWPVAVVLVVAAAGMGVVATGHFKRGTAVVAAAALLAALLRAVLSTPAAGVLAVRSRLLDVATTGVLGLAVLGLVLIVPPLR